MRASSLAQQLDLFSSTSVDATSTLQLVWSDDDDMRPSTKRHKRRERRRRAQAAPQAAVLYDPEERIRTVRPALPQQLNG